MSDGTIDNAIHWLNQLNGLPAGALVFLWCIAFGYGLRFVKWFDNSGIPVAVILMGGLTMFVLADSRADHQAWRLWIGRNLVVGLIIGFISWMTHNVLLSRIENWIAAKYPDSKLTETALFKKDSGGATVQLISLCSITCLFAVLFSGCQSTSTNMFHVEQAAVSLASGAYSGWTNYLALNKVSSQASNEVKQARLKFAATVSVAESLRLSLTTNSAVGPQWQSAVAGAAYDASNLVWLVNFYQKQ